jgi:hypothetical protein
MRNFIKQLFFVFIGFSFVPVVNAEQGWIVSAKVVRVVGTWNGGINVRISPELTGCTSQSGYGPTYASLYPDHAGIDRIHSILLAAYMSDKPVAIYLVDNTCKIGEVELGGRL